MMMSCDELYYLSRDKRHGYEGWATIGTSRIVDSVLVCYCTV